jgi:hypothetical protein
MGAQGVVYLLKCEAMSSPLSSFSWKIISILFYIFGSKASSKQ